MSSLFESKTRILNKLTNKENVHKQNTKQTILFIVCTEKSYEKNSKERKKGTQNCTGQSKQKIKAATE